MKIAITGKAQHGKSTVANYIAKRYGYTELSLSKVLKQCVYTFNPIVDYKPIYEFHGELNADTLADFEPIRFQDLINEVGIEQAKKNPEVRRCYNMMGSDIGRDILDIDIWWKKLQEEIIELGVANIVVPDLRYDNDACLFDFVIKVIREEDNQLKENANHQSEKGISDNLVNVVVYNTGSLEELYETIDNIIKQIDTAEYGSIYV